MIAVWQADVYPKWLAGAPLLSILFGAANRLYQFPALWEHSLFAIVFTITMGLTGIFDDVLTVTVGGVSCYK